MTIYEAIQNRHAVRKFIDKELDDKAVMKLKSEIDKCNEIADLHMQLITHDENVFKGIMAHYGGFRNVSNYIALVGKSGKHSAEKLGYYGEHLVLIAQRLGLNTCWVAATYKKGKCKAVINDDQSLVCIIALGYGQTQGIPHKSKSMEQLCNVKGEMPDWFKRGMKAVLLAPTAMNKQNFIITLKGDDVIYDINDSKYSEVDLGIIKYHFEIGAGLIDMI